MYELDSVRGDAEARDLGRTSALLSPFSFFAFFTLPILTAIESSLELLLRDWVAA